MSTLALVFGFLGCALVFSVLAVGLRPARYGRGAPRFRLRVACVATLVWAMAAIFATLKAAVTGSFVLYSGVLLLAVWTWQLEVFARATGQSALLCRALNLSGPVVAAGGACLLVFAPASPLIAQLLPIAGLVLATLGLVALEQILRAESGAARAALRWMALGQGSVLVVMLLIFAESLLFSAVPVEPWVTSGYALALSGLALRRGATLMPDWSLGVALSRTAAFYTTSLVVVGSYLVLLSMAGWWLASSSLGWGRFAQIAFSFLSVATLAVLVFSGPMRRRIKVGIDKHFYPQRYDYRHEWLRFIRTLSETDSTTSVAQKAIRAVTQIIESPCGTLWRLDESGDNFERAVSWPDQAVARRDSLAVHAKDTLATFLSRTAWLIDLRELRNQPGQYEGLRLETARYGAGQDDLIVPLLHVDRLYGWLVMERPAALHALSFEDRDLLKTAGRQVAAYLAQYDADARLAESRQFEAYNRMTTFVMHDLKNMAAQLKLIAQNAERHKRNPEFIDDAMRTIGSSAARMTKLISQLAGAAQTGEVEAGTMQTLDLAALVERTAVRCSAQSPVPQVVVLQRPVVFADAERLAAVIEHSIRNAQEATSPDGEVRLEVDRAQGRPVLRIVDSGAGMDEAFLRDRLFRPFDTTKGTRGMGIGAFQIREYLRGLGGSVEVESEPGRGTSFALVFPPVAVEPMARRAG